MKTVSLLLCALAPTAFPQLSPSATWATHFANEYQVFPNVTYLTASNVELKLDVYQRRGMTTPQPTVIYMHGGFWVAGNKEGAIMALMPWLEMGYNVVNVEYRLGRVALAPAALEDCFCALRFLSKQAKNVQHRRQPHHRHRRVGRRPSRIVAGHHSRKRRTRPRMLRALRFPK